MADEIKENKTYLNYGIITGVVLVMLFVLFYVFDLLTNKAIGLLPALVYIVLVVVAQIKHAKALDGNITYGNLFAVGFKTAAAATAIYLVFMIIFVLLVPSYKDLMLEQSRVDMVKKGLTADQIKQGMAISKKFFTVGVIGGTLVIDLIIGLVAALIGAAIAKKNPRPQASQV